MYVLYVGMSDMQNWQDSTHCQDTAHTQTHPLHTHTQIHHSHRTHMTPAACFSYLRCPLSLFFSFLSPSLSFFVPSSHWRFSHFPLSDHVGVSVCVFVFWVSVWVFLTILLFFWQSLPFFAMNLFSFQFGFFYDSCCYCVCVWALLCVLLFCSCPISYVLIVVYILFFAGFEYFCGACFAM